MAKLKVLYVASEAAPLVKTGGLGDVAGALPAALAGLGHEVSLVTPAYQQIDKSAFTPVNMEGASAWAGQDWPIEAWQGEINGVHVYLLGSPPLFQRSGLYADHYGDYPDNLARFSFFNRAIIKLCQALELTFDILHVNDWQSALLPAILTTGATTPTPLNDACKVLTIHNLAYQGIYPANEYYLTGLPTHFFQMEGIEYYGNLSLLKAGIVCSDAINTVSPTYAEEIKTPELGHGMDGILRKRAAVLSGIINGADYSIWSPEQDPFIPANYWPGRFKPKKLCRNTLLDELNLLAVENQPVLGMVGRIAWQKGIDIMVPALSQLLSEEDFRVVLLGSGDTHYEHMLQNMADEYPGKVCLITQFSEKLAHLIQAGSDMLLMPSLYEPCGLSQLYALRYGTIPIVHATGGLKDTIEDYDEASRQGTGFKFNDYDVQALLWALKRAFVFFQKPRIWQGIMKNAMTRDFSWDKSALQYVDMYERYLNKPRGD